MIQAASRTVQGMFFCTAALMVVLNCVQVTALCPSTQNRPSGGSTDMESVMIGSTPVCEIKANCNSTASREWIIQLPLALQAETLALFGSGAPGNVVWRGLLSKDGPSVVIYQGSRSELQMCLWMNPGVLFVEESTQVTAAGLRLSKGQNGERRLAAQTVDESLWGLDRIDDEIGLNHIYDNQGLTGAGAHVYVLDTGIRTTHQEFEGRAIPELDVTLEGGYQKCDGQVDCAVDRHGHGTHVAGTIAGKRVGVAKQAYVHAVKVLGDNGSGSMAGIVRAMSYVVFEGLMPAVISMSLGCPAPCKSRAQDAAIQAAVYSGVTVVVAAGNKGYSTYPDACDYAPAGNPLVITVGSISIRDDKRSGFSNIGSCLDIFAPGSSILSASARDDTAEATFSGTSMACPHVSGVVALMLSREPSLKPSQVKQMIMAEAGKGLVKDTCGSPNRLLYMGSIGAPAPSPPVKPAADRSAKDAYFVELAEHACEEVDAQAILDEDLCKEAGVIMGIPDYGATTYEADRPEGCYILNGNRTFMSRNVGKGAETSSQRNAYHPICMIVQPDAGA